MKDLIIWKNESWEDLIVKGSCKKISKRDLTKRVELSSYFSGLREPLDFNKLVSLGDNKYSDFKVPVALLNSLSEYHNKIPEEIDFVDLAQMYFSIKDVLDVLDHRGLEKWKEANKLSFFGSAQYELMDKYFKSECF